MHKKELEITTQGPVPSNVSRESKWECMFWVQSAHLEKRDLRPTRYALEFVDVLRVGFLHRLEYFLIVPPHLVRLILVQQDGVQVVVSGQESFDVALERPALKQSGDNHTPGSGRIGSCTGLIVSLLTMSYPIS